jgi:tRNA-splicing ligase RtcB (3'-phosphate/5'-hydroxy nucleic acid ligase)
MISGKILKQSGWKQGRALGLARAAAASLADAHPEMDQDAILNRLDSVRQDVHAYLDHPILGPLAAELERTAREKAEREQVPELRANPVPYRTWGAEGIDTGAVAQMDAAMRLPVSVAGALMPDAHVGYGLPIGGVLATHEVVIPYAVGVDIACRMRLSVYPESPKVLEREPRRFESALLKQTHFGAGVKNPNKPEHDVLYDDAWSDTRLTKGLQGIASQQLGTSGSGNHFVEWGSIEVTAHDEQFGLGPGRYLALLSHSGSRGVGFKIANAYSTIAMDMHRSLDPAVRHLAWLSLLGDAGQEYWRAMELAGRFASANHEIIHRAVSRAVGLHETAHVENHHNYAWRETVRTPTGERVDAIVHRKGATPAGDGVLGIIPGSMADPGFVVRGKGLGESLNSAAHGAGRAMSRRAAIQQIAKRDVENYLRERGVTLLGGGTDESPQAYKRIEQVIERQTALVDVIGTFQPKIVRMAGEPGDD